MLNLFFDSDALFGADPFLAPAPRAALLMVWGINGAFIIGIFFTMFISWIKFPAKQSMVRALAAGSRG